MSSEALAARIALNVVLLFFSTPIVLIVAVIAGKLSLGSTTVLIDPSETAVSVSERIDADEQIVAATVPARSNWRKIAALGIVLIPSTWGVPLLAYANRVRTRPKYVFTDKRLIIEERTDTESFSIDRIGQVQTGSSAIESIINRGHVAFSIDHERLEKVTYLRNSSEFADSIGTL